MSQHDDHGRVDPRTPAADSSAGFPPPRRGASRKRRRPWRSLQIALILAIATFNVYLGLVGMSQYESPIGVVHERLAPLLVIGLLFGASRILWVRAGLRATSKTRHWFEIVPALLSDQQEYCLILRPFGRDGETLMQKGWLGRLSRMVTLEQVVASAMRSAADIPTMAVVDSAQDLAVSGPTYIRSAHSEWRFVVEKLLNRAAMVVLLLPPGQSLKASFAWEVEQIGNRRLQSRTLIVLPGSDPDGGPEGYRTARRNACIVLAALDRLDADISSVRDFEVDHYLRALPDRVLAVAAPTGTGEETGEMKVWHVADAVTGSSYRAYAESIQAFAALTRADLSKLPFRSRYPFQ